jgi:hypothetical protein
MDDSVRQINAMKEVDPSPEKNVCDINNPYCIE